MREISGAGAKIEQWREVPAEATLAPKTRKTAILGAKRLNMAGFGS
jgi:hypothetical protein